ncbi:MAG TPA: signal peptide peptidase SppA [Deltaproteobacteria bacterium]|nr:signal peptide peptidase SppA [Deltaproteobacteria bacterium]
MRKHPVLSGVVILLAIVVVFYLFFYKAGSDSGKVKRFSVGNQIGVVSINGPIYDSMKIREHLEDFGRDGSITAVILRVDSPGGGVAASQEIFDAVVELKKQKKVVASLGSIAASGGYLVACSADQIVANPGTITGSISAIMQFANIEELLNKIGLKSSVVKSGRYKDIGSPLRDMTPEEKKIIQELVDDIYNQFVDVVVKERNMPREKVLEIADGRIFSGRRALELGLVDHLGDIVYAAKLATELAGKKGRYDLVYPRKKRESVFDYLLESAASVLSDSFQERMETVSGVSYLYYPY